MSLLDNGPHTVTVYPMVVEGTNRYGNPILTRGEGIVLEGVSCEPYGAGSLSGLESEDETEINDQITVRGALTEDRPAWPGGTHSIIDWDGVEYDQKGLAKHYTRGLRTKHFLVRIKRRGAEVK